MHRIIKSYLSEFVTQWGIESDTEPRQFEKYVNYCCLSQHTLSRFDPDEVTTEDGQIGIDGCAFIIDEDVVTSKEDAEIVFQSHKRNHQVEILFIQSKSGEAFDRAEVLGFGNVIKDIISETPQYTYLDTLKEAKKILSVILENANKIKDGRPNLHLYFSNTGEYQEPRDLEIAKKGIITEIESLSLFNSVSFSYSDRNELIRYWKDITQGVESKLEMFSSASLPPINGVEEAYLAVVQAKKFVENILMGSDRKLRTFIFDENVRAFLGYENPVNNAIRETIQSSENRKRFPVLNNGITIVSPDVKIQNNVVSMKNFQIVNGCQSSTVLFDSYGQLEDDVMVTLKIIETTQEEIFSEVVRATNNQSKVAEDQFVSLRPIVKKIEQFFNSYDDATDPRLYFERRERQYAGKGHPQIRIYDLKLIAKCVAAMFSNRPDLAFKYPKQIFIELKDEVFGENNKEIIYYAACLCLYRLHLLISSGLVPQNMKRFKWHILALFKTMVAGKIAPSLHSNKIESYCGKLIEECRKPNTVLAASFNKSVTIVQSLGEVTDDRLKRKAIWSELIQKIE
jgi:hypothetical protein